MKNVIKINTRTRATELRLPEADAQKLLNLSRAMCRETLFNGVLSEDEMIAIGWLVMTASMDAFDPSRNYSLYQFAYKGIKREFFKEAYARRELIARPRDVKSVRTERLDAPRPAGDNRAEGDDHTTMDLPSGDDPTDTKMLREHENDCVRQAVAKLPVALRTVGELLLLDYQIAEIASHLDLSLSATKALILEVHAHLRPLLRDRAG